MTINSLIELLKQSGVNSKKQVLDLLKHPTVDDLLELARDCNERVAIMRCPKYVVSNWKRQVVAKCLTLKEAHAKVEELNKVEKGHYTERIIYVDGE